MALSFLSASTVRCWCISLPAQTCERASQSACAIDSPRTLASPALTSRNAYAYHQKNSRSHFHAIQLILMTTPKRSSAITPGLPLANATRSLDDGAQKFVPTKGVRLSLEPCPIIQNPLSLMPRWTPALVLLIPLRLALHSCDDSLDKRLLRGGGLLRATGHSCGRRRVNYVVHV